jgi:hypothetical protein
LGIQSWLWQRLSSPSTTARIRQARRSGHGLYVADWLHSIAEHSPVDAVLEWTRSTIGASRRPFGIDHFELALAWRPLVGDRVHTHRFGRLRPIDLYGEAFPVHLERFFGQHPVSPAPGRVAVALFSWGDVVHEALP